MWGARRALLRRPYPFDWYVDSVNGSDSNSGKAPAQAFQTIAALEAAGIRASDGIGLALASHWREQLDITVDGVFIGTYGSGAVPILDASDVVGAGSWSKTGGQTNVYEASVSLAGDGVNDWVNAWEDGEFLARVANVAACDAAAGSYYPTANSGNITLYIHPYGSTDPTSDGKTYECTIREAGIWAASADGLTITGIETRNNISESGSLKVGSSATITNCTCRNGSKHNLYYGDGSVLDNVTAENAYYGGTSGAIFVYNEDTPSGLGLVHRNCTAQLTGNTITLSKGHISGYTGHKNVGGTFGAITFENCAAIQCANGVSNLQDTTNLALTGLTLTGCTKGIWQNTATTTGSFTISGGTYTGTSMTYGVQITLSGVDVTIQNMAFNCENIIAAIYHNAAGLTLTVDSCTFTDNTTTVGQQRSGIQANNASANLVVDTCQFLGGNWRQYIHATSAGTVKSDYNTFAEDNPGPDAMVMDGISYSPISTDWIGANITDVGDLDGVATQQDANSTILA